MAMTRDGQLLVSVSEDNKLKVWDMAAKPAVRSEASRASDVTAVAVIASGRRILVAQKYGYRGLELWDLNSDGDNEVVCTFYGHSDKVNAVAVTADEKRAISASEDNTLKLWDMSSGRELRTLSGHLGPVTAVAVTADGQSAVSTSADCTVRVWDMVKGRELHTLTGHSNYVTAVDVAPDGRVALSASWDDTLKVWDPFAGRELLTLRGHSERVEAAVVTPDGRRGISASCDNTVRVWNLETGECLATFTCDSSVNCCGYSDALKLIVAGDAGGHLHFLRLEEPKPKS